MGEFFRRLSARPRAELGMPPLSDAPDRRRSPSSCVAVLPGALAAYWLGIFALNLYLAGRIARASGRLGRDWPDLPALAYPPGFPLLAGRSRSPPPSRRACSGVAGTSFSGALLFAYLLAGLALMHFIARGRGALDPVARLCRRSSLLRSLRRLALTLAGLLEPVLKLKRRFGASPPVNLNRNPQPQQRSNSMQVILLERIGRLGQMGDVVNVKDGYRPQLPAAAEEGAAGDARRTSPGSRRTAPSSRRATSS